ncbi:hypothetical protein ACFYNO_39410 [Kitasatospora sp. NPDC006697]|uniref:hypothetical protein n=1 Tax=Kitasatospora sp. NPDC006697 TaxID=3364020 RepID=UPI0036904069
MSARPPRRRVRRRAALLTGGAVLVTAAAAAALLGFRSPADPSRPVTGDEAEQLSLSRLTTYEASPARVTVTVPGPQGSTRVEGLVDYRAQHAVGAYTDGLGGSGLLVWDRAGLGVAPDRSRPDPATAADPARAAAGLPTTSWSPRSYTTDPLDLALRLTMALGADRPDNAQLLAQSGARRLREESLDGHRYTVFAGPLPRAAADRAPGAEATAHLTYWVDRDGVLRRAEAQLPGLRQPLAIELTGRQVAEQVPAAPWQGIG